MTTALRLAFLCFGLSLLVLSGCSPSKVKINGKIIKGGTPLIVSKETYVTLQFVRDTQGNDSNSGSISATFDQQSGTYKIELPPGKYTTNFIMAPPPKDGKPSMPGPPVKSKQAYDLTKDQELNIEIP
jgi:hypothetical protein